MLIKANGEFKQGLNPIIVDGVHEGAEMDFSVLKLFAGDVQEMDVAGKEVVYLLVQGEVEMAWRGRKEVCKRESCFRNDPYVLQVPANEKVVITGIGADSEVAVIAALSDNEFEPVFYTPDMCQSEQRGEGTLRETATRIVRNIVNLDGVKFSKFFMGEVVNFPGKWSSYPPHQHEQPEFYFYKFFPENGYGFSEDGDNAFKTGNNDCGLFINRARHSQSAAPGYAMYYIWVIHHTDGNPHTGPDTCQQYMWTMDPAAKIFPEE